MSNEPRLPFFVYGTLRTGHGNHRLFEGATTLIENAVAPDHAVYGHGIPFAIDNPGTAVVGELMHVADDLYEQVLLRVDRLEGHRPGGGGLYTRVVRTVIVTDADGTTHPVEAWIYHSDLGFVRGESLIASGDWARPNADPVGVPVTT